MQFSYFRKLPANRIQDLKTGEIGLTLKENNGYGYLLFDGVSLGGAEKDNHNPPEFVLHDQFKLDNLTYPEKKYKTIQNKMTDIIRSMYVENKYISTNGIGYTRDGDTFTPICNDFSKESFPDIHIDYGITFSVAKLLKNLWNITDEVRIDSYFLKTSTLSIDADSDMLSVSKKMSLKIGKTITFYMNISLYDVSEAEFVDYKLHYTIKLSKLDKIKPEDYYSDIYKRYGVIPGVYVDDVDKPTKYYFDKDVTDSVIVSKDAQAIDDKTGEHLFAYVTADYRFRGKLVYLYSLNRKERFTYDGETAEYVDDNGITYTGKISIDKFLHDNVVDLISTDGKKTKLYAAHIGLRAGGYLNNRGKLMFTTPRYLCSEGEREQLNIMYEHLKRITLLKYASYAEYERFLAEYVSPDEFLDADPPMIGNAEHLFKVYLDYLDKLLDYDDGKGGWESQLIGFYQKNFNIIPNPDYPANEQQTIMTDSNELFTSETFFYHNNGNKYYVVKPEKVINSGSGLLENMKTINSFLQQTKTVIRSSNNGAFLYVFPYLSFEIVSHFVHHSKVNLNFTVYENTYAPIYNVTLTDDYTKVSYKPAIQQINGVKSIAELKKLDVSGVYNNADNYFFIHKKIGNYVYMSTQMGLIHNLTISTISINNYPLTLNGNEWKSSNPVMMPYDSSAYLMLKLTGN